MVKSKFLFFLITLNYFYSFGNNEGRVSKYPLVPALNQYGYYDSVTDSLIDSVKVLKLCKYDFAGGKPYGSAKFTIREYKQIISTYTYTHVGTSCPPPPVCFPSMIPKLNLFNFNFAIYKNNGSGTYILLETNGNRITIAAHQSSCGPPCGIGEPTSTTSITSTYVQQDYECTVGGLNPGDYLIKVFPKNSSSNPLCSGIPAGITNQGVVCFTINSVANTELMIDSVGNNNCADGINGKIRLIANNLPPAPALLKIIKKNYVSDTVLVSESIHTYSTSAIDSYSASDTIQYHNLSHVGNTLIFELKKLPSATYAISIQTYPLTSLCTPYFTQEIIVNETPISSLTFSKTDILCPNVNNGAITVGAKNGAKDYHYSFFGTVSSTIVSSATVLFSSLPSTGYTVTVVNAPFYECADQLTYNGNINAPDPFIFNKTNTSYYCYNSANAQINISPAQGTPPYTFSLQNSLDATTWTNTTATTTLTTYNITDEAYYRLIAVDANLCTYTSDTTFFDRPDTLKINNVTVSDIKCLGEQGKLLLNRFGGTPPYQQRYTTNAWGAQSPFGDTTLLNANTYQVKLIDANLCEVTNVNTYTITAPTELLTMSLTKKQYNGRDLSCFGSADGEVTLSAGGGNGAVYSNSYQFNQNAGVFVNNPVFSGLTFGTYTYSVRDNRNCIVTTFTVLQTTPVLTATTSAKQNVVCFSGNNGEIITLANGGTAPYRFTIGASTTKYDNSNFTFTGLTKGLYTLQVTDTNNCIRIYTDSIIALNPNMNTTLLQQKDVTCFGGTNGFAKTQTTGGIFPYTYSWSNSSNADSLINAAAGNYSLIITDQQACSDVFNIIINQPSAIQVTPNAYLGCNSNNSGIVSVNAIGGIPPYLYKLDVDTLYKTNPVYKQLNIGNYIATVKDSNNCVSSAIATINETLSAPQPVFMVSSFSQQSDTLVLIDISEPKPDSLVWLFADNITYRAGNMFAPQVVFADTGSHIVTMRAFYDGCEIAVSKAVKVNKQDSLTTENALLGIKSLVVSPNPNNGNFTITTELHKAQNFAIFIYNQTGVEFYRAPFTNSNYQSVSVAMPSDLPTGEYVVWVLSEYDAMHFNIVINK